MTTSRAIKPGSRLRTASAEDAEEEELWNLAVALKWLRDEDEEEW